MVRATLEDARDRVAALFGVRPRQVVFTSGGTEAVNAAVWGVPGRRPRCPGGVRRSRALGGARGLAPATAPSSRSTSTGTAGSPRPPWARHWSGVRPATAAPRRWSTARRPTTRSARSRTWPAWSTAAGRPASPSTSTRWPPPGTSPSTSDSLGADLVSVSSHKLGGPAGVGALILRRGLRIDPLLVGGEQERGRRAGLEDVTGAVGFGAAAEALAGPGRIGSEAAAAQDADRSTARRRPSTSTASSPTATWSGRVPHIVCLGVTGVEAEPVAARPRPGRGGRPLRIVVLVGVPRAVPRAAGHGGGRRAVPAAVRRLVDHRRRRRRLRRSLR